MMTKMTPLTRRAGRLRVRYFIVAPLLALSIGFGTVWTNAFGAADRLDVLMMRVSAALRLTPEGGVCIDAGSCVGYYAMNLARKVGSSGVVSPLPNLAVSNTGRAALAGYLKTLAGEVAGGGVTVNMVLPGRIDTDRVAQLDQAAANRTGTSLEEARRSSVWVKDGSAWRLAFHQGARLLQIGWAPWKTGHLVA